MDKKDLINKLEEFNSKVSYFRTRPEVLLNSEVFIDLTNVSYYLLSCIRHIYDSDTIEHQSNSDDTVPPRIVF